MTSSNPPNGTGGKPSNHKNTSTSADYALRTVLLIAQRGQLAVSELARELAIAPSTAHRVLANCRRAGFVRQDSHGGPYVIGPALHEIALTVSGSRNMRDAAAPVLADLHERYDETFVFYVLEGKDVRVVQALPGSRSRTLAPTLGRLFPAHCTAGGKALLSRESPEELERRYPGRQLAPFTDRSITDWPTLLDELARVHKRGWAVSVGEFDSSTTGLAVPVVLSSGAAIGSLGVVGYVSWLQTRAEIDALTPALIAAADAITARMRN
ncbi:IclR family transcriptional regulator [Rhodococcus sp. 06-156-3C]|uniref:IclR family transcriptional regulator n=1 Tax=Nocardiaceae TaxID=85025 RepID=UPI000689C1D7|nr:MULTISPECIES: IclR family transcriptional regulator [Rhodococcus]OZD18197.1 IclR family transcriptional regulator [Rhodococcus sp. 06-156-4C]OZD18794.1 IclR family transcriptional regulator [Rhodococcus sp. 06-156-3C]OZD22304.1 IclR family transcriptional regulator [Rhodococcus sp. 06-156-4a]OZD34110.1 IclR family transcriptional regulator [Rhodococcus sp. 06-156-3b]OZD38847.1 IclR family transcriptional regulator [Rhodococcus sp. 06-156-3]